MERRRPAGVHRRLKRGTNSSRILEGGLALDCPKAPDECVRTHSRAASAMQSLPRVRYSAALESRSAWWRADCESETGAIGFCWLPKGIGEALKWVRRAVRQTGRSRTGSLSVSGASRGSSEPFLGPPRVPKGRGWSLSPRLSWARSCLCAPCRFCEGADEGGHGLGLVRYRIVGMGSRYVGRPSPEAQHDPGSDLSRGHWGRSRRRIAAYCTECEVGWRR